jgi:hypothetical protein
MRTEKLVGGTGEEIAADILHIDRTVRRILHRIDIHQRARILCHFGQLLDRVHRPQQIRRITKGGDLRFLSSALAKSSRSSVPSSTSISTQMQVASLILRDQHPGRMLASWSSRVTRMLSPACRLRASERDMCRVRVVMLLPKMISSGREALRKSAMAACASCRTLI